jgi:hypothetical protein
MEAVCPLALVLQRAAPRRLVRFGASTIYEITATRATPSLPTPAEFDRA